MSKSITEQLTIATRHVREEYARAAILKAGGSVRLLLPHVTAQIGLELVRDRFEARVQDEKGAVRRDGDKPMALDDLMGELKRDADFAPAFRATPALVAPKTKKK